MAKVQPPKDTDTFPPRVPPPPPRPKLQTLEVTGCELQTAPSHVLLVKLVGEVGDLVTLQKAIQRALPTDTGSTAPLPPELAEVVESKL